MALQDARLVAGLADFYWKEFDGVTSNDPVTGNVIDLSAWTQAGHIADGNNVGLEYAAQYFDGRTASTNHKVIKKLIGHDLKVATALAETALSQMGLVLPTSVYTAGAMPGTNPNLLEVGDNAIKEYSLAIDIPAEFGPDGLRQLFFVQRAVSVDPAEFAWGKELITNFNAGFEGLKDPLASAQSNVFIGYEITEA